MKTNVRYVAMLVVAVGFVAGGCSSKAPPATRGFSAIIPDCAPRTMGQCGTFHQSSQDIHRLSSIR